MQQVSAKEILASAEVVDPRRLPVLMRSPGRRAVAVARHTWVLHRQLVVRAATALALLAGLVAVYEMREPIFGALEGTGDLIEGRVAGAGFAIGEISISGQALTADTEIVKALAIQPALATFSYDADAARARLEALPAISAATVRKVYPGHLDVAIIEKEPVARWRVDGVTYLVDGDGAQIAEDSGAFTELPLIVGDGAADDAMIMIEAMKRYDDIRSGLAALSRISDRRWDLIYYTGLRVQLPELGVGQALRLLESYQERYALLDRDILLIDLRVPGIVTVKPTEATAEKLAEMAERRKKGLPALPTEAAVE